MKKFLVLTLMCVLGLFNLSAQEPETIVIGNGGDAINYSPSYIDSYTSVTQQIFVAEEMQNKSGKIQSVSFKCTSRTATRTFKVYMVNTNKTSFSGVSDWVALTSQDLVFEGSVSFSADNWTKITFCQCYCSYCRPQRRRFGARPRIERRTFQEVPREVG